MSAPGRQIAHASAVVSAPSGRSPLAHLLHALNQPLTGLQCSLELALVGPRTPEQYIRALRDGLQLAERMRMLVEAIRELADMEQDDTEPCEKILLNSLLRETADDLRPVAEAREVRIVVEGDEPLSVQVAPRKLATLTFRFLESAMSLAARGSVFHVASSSEADLACLVVRWDEAASLPEHSPFSRSELGLLIAQAGWKRAGANWASERTGHCQTVTVRLRRAHTPR
jgi:signal transduction histidine kinase